MSTVSVNEPTGRQKWVAGTLVIVYALVTMLPLAWIFLTGFKSPPDSISYPPKVFFEPTLEGYVNVFTTRTRQTQEYLESLGPPQTWYEEIVRKRDMVIAGPSKFGQRFTNSIIIGFGSTFLSVFLGTLAAYAFSRFRIPLKDDLMFFILSTRMMPPIAVAIPIFLMYRTLGLSDTHLGMILLYTAVNISLAVWLLKGFIDEIPREYEEAALIDGYTRLQAFRKVVLPQGRDRYRIDRDLLLDLLLERICLRVAADIGDGPDRSSVHSNDHRRRRSRLASRCGRSDAVSAAGPGLHHPAQETPAQRHNLRSRQEMSAFIQGLLELRRGPWELLASVLIGAGVFMLMQPFMIIMYTYSFAVILLGTVMFVIVSHFRE